MSSPRASMTGCTAYPDSVVETDDARFFMVRGEDGSKHLVMDGDGASFQGERHGDRLLCSPNAWNAALLRDILPWLRPQPLGLQTSMGFGDRLGLATPGHARAAEQYRDVAPIFAQQSVRENARTGRSPQQVVDDAMWGLFQAGWRSPWGADADHLKSVEELEDFVAAGYTLYTIDPGEHVDDEAAASPPAKLERKLEGLPWNRLETSVEDLERRFLGRSFCMGPIEIRLDREALFRAAAKYGRAILQTARMYRHLTAQMSTSRRARATGHAFDLEVSVDETETATTPEEHLFIAHELRRLGVAWVSLAPRYVGRFEKGVDYIGDLEVFEQQMTKHAAIAQAYGPYKLSVHSGSDKFSIYPIIAGATSGLVHVKTAGTSYLEALRTVAQVDPFLFRRILTIACDYYTKERATYHVSGQLSKVCPIGEYDDDELPDLLSQFDVRQVLHVTYGSVLDRLGDRLRAALKEHEELYADLLTRHFERHLKPFAGRRPERGTA